MNQLSLLYAIYSPFCNPCRGFCCNCKNGCCGIDCGCNDCRCRCKKYEKCCCYCCSCGCCLSHIPQHHVPMVRALGFIVSLTTLVSWISNLRRILAFSHTRTIFDDLDGAVMFMIGMDTNTPDSTNPPTKWELFLLGFNYISGYIGGIGVLKTFWNYSYILLSYWVRNDINQLENQKIHKIVINWLKSAFIFHISVNETDTFAKINDDTPISKRIRHPCTCHSCTSLCGLLSIGILFGCSVILSTTKLFIN